MLAVTAQSSMHAGSVLPASRDFLTTCQQAAMPVMTVTEKTVKNLLDTPAHGQHVRLIGKLVNCPGSMRYRFAVETGEISTRIGCPVAGNISL